MIIAGCVSRKAETAVFSSADGECIFVCFAIDKCQLPSVCATTAQHLSLKKTVRSEKVYIAVVAYSAVRGIVGIKLCICGVDNRFHKISFVYKRFTVAPNFTVTFAPLFKSPI